MAKYSRVQFEEMVALAMHRLPERARKHIKNVAVCVQDHPTPEQLKETGMRRGDTLLGLFEGVPETEWGKGFGNVLPDKITIFQEGIEQFVDTPEEIEREVRLTVWHEVAHHFGFTEDDLEQKKM
ncbi:MAG: metallopeptidase family protein [Patescibacteria group bacterium]